MKGLFSMVFGTVVLGVIVFGSVTEYAHARGGRGGFRGGEFSGFLRDGPQPRAALRRARAL